MKEYKRRFFLKSLIYSPFTIIILLILIFFLSQKLFSIYQKYNITKSDLEILKEEENNLLQKQNNSQYKLDQIKSERGLEQYIRETYSVKLNGENVIIIYDAPTSTYKIEKSPTIFELLKKWYNEKINFLKDN